MKGLTIKAILRNHSDPVDVTSIDFKTGTFTWDYRGHLENVESIDDAEFIVEGADTK
ncbi:hypothetical protein LOZ80_26105 [Paenibacillus sp. HWE-109]|uniref:hypothetical protein n=1 Tax=Paenibacillus sp. HWE-109 TaxID=1306526 RepID=UPI001EDF9916|nr:hypothetical protein [Paenibacillus sp. HWE-109]UKS25054.1 hypothetical protein LOZ80_26105 [Paenibacillus sp. HWE-109]